ncbi:C25 family cysteine peptidase [Aerosakkonema funiforme]|uniref:C25 family cysteine peptidase n=1 Tax=Aerosakkonema funiforme TaxID=1246630 RepID=UPI0035B9888F
MDAERFVFNGINGTTGDYLQSPLTPEEVYKIAQSKSQYEKYHPKKEYIQNLTDRKKKSSFRLKPGVDGKDLSQTGWGIIFAHNENPKIEEALSELLKHRQSQAKDKYKKYIYDAEEQESKTDFLARYGVGYGAVDPKNVPYYLLIVGDPETISYRFQCELDVQYAVGRIYFETPEEYAQYARSVVEAETGKHSFSRRASFFGVENDDATQLSANYLVKPLANYLSENLQDWKLLNWDVKTIVGEQATKAQLKQLLGGSETPSLLFTASHGMGFDINDTRFPKHQGALICQDWSGQRGNKIPEEVYFSGDDISSDANLLGLIAFHFACYSAGTPKLSEFSDYGDLLSKRSEIALNSFVAHLPQRLLGHPNGGALAVIGHVERAWACSFRLSDQYNKEFQQLQVFESAIDLLMKGYPIGFAFDFFNEAHAELATSLSKELQEIRYKNQKMTERDLSKLWLTTQDMANYVIMGDPAVRLVVSDNADSNDTAPRRIEPVILHSPQTSNFPKAMVSEAPQESFSEELGKSRFQQAQIHLSQTLEEFIEAAKDRAEQLESIIYSANTLLEALKKLN